MNKIDWILIVVISLTSSALYNYVNENFIEPKPKYIVADIVQIVNEHKNLMDKKLNRAKSNEEMATIYNESIEYMNKAYSRIDSFGKQNNVIIFQKNAIVGKSIEDYTNEIRKLVNQ